jgi:hypothetical protein
MSQSRGSDWREGERWQTLPLCDECWFELHYGRRPVRRREPDITECARCTVTTMSGIYVRARRCDLQASRCGRG